MYIRALPTSIRAPSSKRVHIGVHGSSTVPYVVWPVVDVQMYIYRQPERTCRTAMFLPDMSLIAVHRMFLVW